MAEWKNNGKLKLLIIVGTRPEIIRLAAVIKKCRTYFDTLLAHTGQNYDYNLNGIFFRDLGLADPDVYLDRHDIKISVIYAKLRQCGFQTYLPEKCLQLFRRKTAFQFRTT